MLSEKMLNALNEQINREFYSAYFYLQMAAYLDDQSLSGMANWMKIQTQEESAHAMILFNYVSERGGFVDLGAIEKPPMDYNSPLEVFEQVYEHEQKVTAMINALMVLANEENDFATRNRLEWFVAEQVEEESNASSLVGALRRIGSGNGIFMLDKELASRSFALPSPLASSE
ncbi:MAG: ferritin [Lentisphaeria bacterium]|nr:ferritin [Lentisphaeria bacterium]